MELKKTYKEILIGLICIGASFVILMIFSYALMRGHRQALSAKDSLEGQVLAINAERTLAERKAQELEGRLGREIIIDPKKIELDAEGEDNRQEGDLWIDRKLNTWTVTLGMVNGLDNGHRLAVYDGDEKVGSVAVVEIFDVIALVTPVEDEAKFSKDLYHVVLLKK